MIGIMLNILAWVLFILLFLAATIVAVALLAVIKAIIDNALTVLDKKLTDSIVDKIKHGK